MKMTGVHCSQKLRPFTRRRRLVQGRKMEREIIRSCISSHDTSLNGRLSLPATFFFGPGRGELPREIRISLPWPDDPTSSPFFLSSSMFLSFIYKRTNMRRKCSTNLITIFSYRGMLYKVNKPNVKE